MGIVCFHVVSVFILQLKHKYRIMGVNERSRVHVSGLLFFVQPQRSIKEVLGACQCAPVKVSRAERWTGVEWLNSGRLTASQRPGVIRLSLIHI